MVIVVNTRFLTKDYLSGLDNFVKDLLLCVAKQHPEDKFYFLFDRPYKDEFVFPENITPLIITPAATNPLLWKYWLDIKVPAALKKIKADVFFSPDGVCSLTTTIPQCLLIPDVAFLHEAHSFKKTQIFFFKKYVPKFLKKGNKIFTTSEFVKKQIIDSYKIDSEKIDVIGLAVRSIFQPLTFQIKQAIKEKYTEGKEYFIYPGVINPDKNLLNLLKAFSLFKKRQRSNWKLVLSGKMAWKNDGFTELLKTYKHRDDVVMTGMVADKEVAKLIGAAYAVIHPSLFVNFPSSALHAMKCNVPLLASTSTIMQEAAGDAALYFDGSNPADIAEKLMLIYKDENLRNELVERGKMIASEYSLQKSADLLWKNFCEIEGS